MPSISSLVAKLVATYPAVHFEVGPEFMWSPTRQTIYYNPAQPHASALLLHELAHALLGHDDYRRDIELISLERQAWDKAGTLTAQFGVLIDEDTRENHLDSYRDWLHARSTCPNCSAVGYQMKKSLYHCVACDASWRVNEARVCALRRHKVAT